MSDSMWSVLRYLLIAVGSFLAGKGYVTMDQVNSFIADLPALIGALTAAGTALWGFYVRFGTRAVPVATAQRSDVPTVNPATGTIER